MLLAPSPIADQLTRRAKNFLRHMRDQDYDFVWHHLLTLDAMELLSTTTFPLYLQAQGDSESFLENPMVVDGLAYAFQSDHVSLNDVRGIRTSFFGGIAKAFKDNGWFEPFDDVPTLAFLEGSSAVLVIDFPRPTKALFLLFVDEGRREYKIDMESLSAFSMVVSAQKIHRLASRAMEAGHERTAIQMFMLVARLSGPYTRLRQLVWDHPVVGTQITEIRKQELRAEYAYTILARDHVETLLADPQLAKPSIDLERFLSETFNGYSQITRTELVDDDLQRLIEMDDTALRRAIAKVLVGVDPVEAEREARKPHTSAEIADMEVLVRRGQDLYQLLMPFKSGREITGRSVPFGVFGQIFRAHMLFEKGVVVFITAKPCSQHLQNYIKMARDRKGWPISVIEHLDLARLLKANDLL